MGQCSSSHPPVYTNEELFKVFNWLSEETKDALTNTIEEVCDSTQNQWENRRAWWKAYRNVNGGDLRVFFQQWLEYRPVPKLEDGAGGNLLPSRQNPIGIPDSPGYFIEKWDWLANTMAGRGLTGFDKEWRIWFIKFLDAHGAFIRSSASKKSVKYWLDYDGTPQHPFNIDEYVVPKRGFKSFNLFFLRFVKAGERQVSTADESNALSVVAPSDGGIFYLAEEADEKSGYELPSKRGDKFELEEAFPGYGQHFIGGPLLDTLLWFTDFHHFFAPVSGKVVEMKEYPGSYNYDFEDFDPYHPGKPEPPADSDKVGWYKELATHKRYVWIIETEEMGLVGMAAIGFFGVGSIVVEDKDKTTWPKGVIPVKKGDDVQKGQYLGHFGYGGSSIVLAFQPSVDGRALTYDFSIPQKSGDDEQIRGPDQPIQANAMQHIATARFS